MCAVELWGARAPLKEGNDSYLPGGLSQPHNAYPTGESHYPLPREQQIEKSKEKEGQILPFEKSMSRIGVWEVESTQSLTLFSTT